MTEQLVREQVASEQIRVLYQRTPEGLIGGALFALLLAWTLDRLGLAGPILPWLAVKLLVVAVRTLDWWEHCRLHLDVPEGRLVAGSVQRWHLRHAVLSALDGISWGAIGPLFLPSGLPIMDGLLIAGIVGVSSVGVFTLSSRLDDAMRFLASTLLPMVAVQVWQGGAVGHYVAGATLLYFGVLWNEGRRHRQRILELLKLRFEQAGVAEQRAEAVRLAERSSEAKSRFLAMVSHELRTPLNGVMGMVELMQRDLPGGTPQAGRLQVMRQSARHLLGLIDELLDISRIEHGRMTLHPEPADPVALAHEVVDLLAASAEAKGLTLALEVAPGVPARVQVDRARFRQILLNLVGNGLKFTSQGGVTLAVAPLHPGPGLQLTVTDTGPGMAADDVEHLFEAFVQGSGGGGLPGSGTGLGLAIARQLARAMGGDIVCHSSPGRGAAFDVSLPLPVASALAPLAPLDIDLAREAAPAPGEGLGRDARILVVEDNPVNALVTTGMLDHLGFRAEVVGDGQAALEVLARGEVDLVLMDGQLPVLDGWEATRRWRAIEAGLPARGRVPILAVTANAIAGDRARCLAAGMDDYLAKPFGVEDLRRLLARHLPGAVTMGA